MVNEIIKNNIKRPIGDVNRIMAAALRAVDPYLCTQRLITKKENKLFVNNIEIDLNSIDNVYLIGTGKAVLPMAAAVMDVFQSTISGGFLIAKHEDKKITKKFPIGVKTMLGSHPVPSEQSVSSTRQMVRFLESLEKNDLVICLISGGGSALMTLPLEGITTEDMRETNRLLLFSGATINEMNTVRKHLDQVKGGGLARKVFPARLITLVLSDVIGDPLDVIASGPTVADPTTFEDAAAIINQYQLEDKIPASVLNHLEDGVTGKVSETVKPGDVCLQRTNTFIIGSLRVAAEAALAQARVLNFDTKILDTQLEGEAREIGNALADELKKMVSGNHALVKPACLIAGGETTVTVRGQGKGGRNQETALSAALSLQGLQDCLFISLATDGEDGPTDAAGAYVDGDTIARGKKLGLDARNFLERNDAYAYLEKTESLILIGPTGTNVNDLVFMFAFNKD